MSAADHGWAMSMDADGIIFAKKCRCGFIYEGESELIQHAYQVGATEALEDAAKDSSELPEADGWLSSVPIATRILVHHWLNDRAAAVAPRETKD